MIELRETLEDTVVEARHEYQSQADAGARADADSEAAAPATTPRQKATRTQAKRGERPKTSDDAKDAKTEQTAKASWSTRALTRAAQSAAIDLDFSGANALVEAGREVPPARVPA